jgi:hypothetical protein
MGDQIQRAAVAICRSRKFETGEGTCSAFCMEFLGSPRDMQLGCPHALRIHGEFARLILDAAK